MEGKVKRLVAFIVTVTLVITGYSTVFAAEKNSAYTKTANLYSLMDAGTYDIFTNYVDGYSMYVDKGMTVDMSYSGVCAVLENNVRRIEVYKQSVAGGSAAGYINYSNKFLNNTVSHVTDYNGTQTIAGREVKLAAWHRAELARVKNDKNYYISIEIPTGSYVYTIFVKSSTPIDSSGGYVHLANNFNTFDGTKNAYTRTSKAVDLDERGWNEETKDFYVKYFTGSSELTWGIFEPETTMFDYNQLNYYEDYFNYKFPILLNYSEFENTYKHPNLAERLKTAYEHGSALELTLQTTENSGNMVYDILNGTYDEFLYDYAKVISDFDHPVLFRLFNEMNGDWCPYSGYNTSKDTLIYKEVYKYVYGIFEEQGANKNTIWIWNPNAESFPNFKWNHSLMYYPGDDYVDIVGMTAYNTGNYYKNETWQEFYQLYNTMYYNYCAWFNQPFMITEFSSASAGGDKAQWIKNMFETIENYKRIKVAVWWDGCDWDAYGNVSRSYFLDETDAVLKAFKKGITKPWSFDSYA